MERAPLASAALVLPSLQREGETICTNWGNNRKFLVISLGKKIKEKFQEKMVRNLTCNGGKKLKSKGRMREAEEERERGKQI